MTPQAGEIWRCTGANGEFDFVVESVEICSSRYSWDRSDNLINRSFALGHKNGETQTLAHDLDYFIRKVNP